MNQTKTIPILLTIIAVLFVSILVLLAVYLPKNQSVPVKIDVAPTPTTVPTIKPTVVVPTTTTSTTPTPTSAITSDWKNYTSSIYKYTIKYPNDWTVKEENRDPTNKDNLQRVNFYQPGYNASEQGPSDKYTSITIDANNNQYTLGNPNRVINTTFANLDASQISTKGGQDSPSEQLWFQKGNDFFIIYMTYSGDKTTLNLYNQILSTFKFTQ